MHELFEAFEANNHELFFVGGFVRDKLLGVESNDIDFATSARPEETMRILKANGLKAIPIGIEFGTVVTEVDGTKIEITTFRSAETYTKGSRHPTVRWGETIEEDLLRRDFTFNAIAMREDGSLVDPFNGAQDLKDGRILTPTDPNVIFKDDPLRMLRAARFEARGLGEVAGVVFCAMRDNAELVRDLSGERVFEEMTKLLHAKHASRGIKLLRETGVLKILFPVGYPESTILDGSGASDEILWAALFNDVASWFHARKTLTMSNAFYDRVEQLLAEENHEVDLLNEVGKRRVVARLGDNLPNFCGLIEKRTHKLLTELRTLKVDTKLPSGTGNVVMDALGIKPGAELGKIMNELKQKLIDGAIPIDANFADEAARIYHELRQP